MTGVGAPSSSLRGFETGGSGISCWLRLRTGRILITKIGDATDNQTHMADTLFHRGSVRPWMATDRRGAPPRLRSVLSLMQQAELSGSGRLLDDVPGNLQGAIRPSGIGLDVIFRTG